MKKLNLLMGVGLAFLSVNAHAQKKYEYEASGALIQKAAEQSKAEDYKTALYNLKKISEYDTNYIFSQAEKVQLYTSMEKYDKALELVDELLEDTTYLWDYYVQLKAEVYLEQEEYEKALETYDDALAFSPMNSDLHYNRGLAFNEAKLTDSAVVSFQRAIFYNYYNVTAHYFLGLTCYENNDYAKAFLAINQVVIQEPELGGSVVGLLNSMAAGEVDVAEDPQEIDPEVDLSSISALIKSGVSADNDYKVEHELSSIPYTKLYYLMMDKLSKEEFEDSFWKENYIDIYDSIKTHDKFNAAVNRSYSFIDDETIQRAIYGKRKETEKFDEQLSEWLELAGSRTGNPLIGGKSLTHQNNRLYGIGERENGKKTGEWNLYTSIATNMGVGHYADNEKDGNFIFLRINGDTSSVSNYGEGELDGPFVDYGDKQALSVEGVYEEGKKQGHFKYYFANGALRSEGDYVDDERSGLWKYYNMIGNVYLDINYVEGEVEGIVNNYYSDGSLEAKTNYKKDDRDGEYKSYFKDGKLNAEGVYSKGLREGFWKFYYPSGKLKESGTYKKGGMTGRWETFAENGTIIEVYDLDESGKINGTAQFFTEDGKLLREEIYKKGDYKGYICYNAAGEITFKAKPKKGTMFIKRMDIDGNVLAEGNFTEGERSGIWKYYNYNGTNTSTEIFTEGRLNGIDSNYYSNGAISSIYTYSQGSLEGYSASFSRNGKINVQRWYTNDNQVGMRYEYNPKGKVVMSSHYLFDELDGEEKYFNNNGDLYQMYEYDGDVLLAYTAIDTAGNVTNKIEFGVGEQLLEKTYMNGNPRFSGDYLNGTAHGTFTWYYPNKQISSTGEFFFGSRNGEWHWYTIDGKVKEKGSYVLGDKVGEWEEYDFLGRLASKSSYDEFGELQSRVYYHYNGEVKYNMSYVDGVAEGQSQFYTLDGTPLYSKFFKKGDFIGYAYGADSEVILAPKGTATVDGKFESGKPSIHRDFRGGSTDGTYVKYEQDGNKQYYAEEKNGDNHGKVETYYAGGQLESSGEYYYGTLHGTFTYYYENGQVYSTTNYVYGEKNGISTYYDEQGNTTLTIEYYYDDVVKVQ